jgi:hypothetical protein
MPICSIYGPGNRLLRRFSTHAPGLGESISVGRSRHCGIVLAGLDDAAGVADMHFALVRRSDGWRLVTPGPPVRLKNGRDAQEAPIAEGQEFAFGSCRLAVAADPAPSSFQFIWQLPGAAAPAAMPLHQGANFIGAAEECDLPLPHPSLRPQHCAVRVADWQLTVEPLGEGGVSLNGRPVTDATPVQAGDLLALGEVRACVAAKAAPCRLPSPVSESALLTWRVVNVVLVEPDVEARDRYGRPLAYLWGRDGRMINERMVEDGYALIYTFPPNVKYADRLADAQKRAQLRRAGFWREGGLKEPPERWRRGHPRK